MTNQRIIDDMPEEITPRQEILMDPHQLVSEYDTPDIGNERHIEQLEAVDTVERLLQEASERDAIDETDKRVVRERYGLGQDQARTLKEVGTSMGVSGERVRAREVRGTASLRKLARTSFK